MALKIIHSSSPTKLIIAGEHSVVYGGIALVAPLDNRKECICKIRKVPKGKGVISIADTFGNGKYFPDGRFEDFDGWFKAKARLIEHILKSEGKGIDSLDIAITLSRNFIPKGTGHSASTACSLALCIYGALGISPTEGKLFEACQAFEEVAHGGRPSGIDARAVISDNPLRFRKEFLEGGKIGYDYEGMNLELPKGSAFIIASTLLKGESPQTTDELLSKFAKIRGISGLPGEIGQGQRESVYGPFDLLVEEISQELSLKGKPEKLGGLLLKNHQMLKECGVSSDTIEEAIQICMENGAYGAKLTGAGGRGGAVLAYCKKKDVGKIIKSLKRAGFAGITAQISSRGACIDK
ncbi:MAG: hypothetical protein AABX01_06685 [Candidatus Micrarchaeota archaeon]